MYVQNPDAMKDQSTIISKQFYERIYCTCHGHTFWLGLYLKKCTPDDEIGEISES